jgi:hypothetical protein
MVFGEHLGRELRIRNYELKMKETHVGNSNQLYVNLFAAQK